MEWIDNKGVLILLDVIILGIVVIHVRRSPCSLRDAYGNTHGQGHISGLRIIKGKSTWGKSLLIIKSR